MKQFTCWDGKCIPLIDRCNGRDDCVDRSDELECHLIEYDVQNYRQERVPKNPFGVGPLAVEVQIDIKSIVEINEPEVKHH